MSYENVTTKEFKKMIGAISYQYDEILKRKGNDPDELRNRFYRIFLKTDQQKEYGKRNVNKFIPLDQCEFEEIDYQHNLVDRSQEIQCKIKALALNETKKINITDDDMYIILFTVDTEHHTCGCWCCDENVDTEKYLVFYPHNRKLSCFIIKLKSSTDNLLGYIQYHKDPKVTNDQVTIESCLRLFGSLVRPLGEKYGYDCLIKSF